MCPFFKIYRQGAGAGETEESDGTRIRRREESAMSSSSSEPRSEQEVIQRFNALRQEVNQLYQKVTKLDAELQEHELVIKAISNMDEKRKCFRLVGGVLVERTVGEVLPAVNTNKGGITGIKEQLQKQFEKKKDELKVFQEKYKITVRGEDATGGQGAQQQAAPNASASKGVLA